MATTTDGPTAGELEEALGISTPVVIPLCSATGKRAYSSKRLAIEMTRKTGNRLRAYFCDGAEGCHLWHVTAQSKREHDRGW